MLSRYIHTSTHQYQTFPAYIYSFISSPYIHWSNNVWRVVKQEGFWHWERKGGRKGPPVVRDGPLGPELWVH